MLRLGIDTGGTCTDAVLYDTSQQQIVAMAKAPTTHRNLERGIEQAIDRLPADLLSGVELMALSTTLATNACVENKGGRVRLIYIGVKQIVVERSYRDYGFENMDCMLFAEGNPKDGSKPDWDCLIRQIKADDHLYDSYAIAQINPKDNFAAYEKELCDRIHEFSDKPIVCAYELFHDLNAIKRGASAYLNAKLLPTIAEFLEAIRLVIAKKQLSVPIVIMRSDGSMMSEEYAKEHPVETLLCGPAASLKGGEFLMSQTLKSENSVIIDMGGTTTDIALIKNQSPVLASRGIEIGNWRTFVKGLYVHTLGLGGDTEVYYVDRGVKLSDRRVVSMSSLAANYPFVVDDLRQLSKDYSWGHSRPLYSYVMLDKDEVSRERYSDAELAVIDALADGPVPILKLAETVGMDLYTLNLTRLENEGVVIRSGLTPTDMMCIKGELDLYDKTAATLALEFMALSSNNDVEKIPDMVYDLVNRRMYLNIAKVLMEDTFGDNKDFAFSREMEALIMHNYDLTANSKTELFQYSIKTNATLVGVGAPIHCFLPEVASRLNAAYMVPEAAGVTNALGAIIGDVRVRENVTIEASNGMDDNGNGSIGYRLYGDEGVLFFDEYEDAKETAIEIARKRAVAKARRQGASEDMEIRVSEKRNTAMIYESEMFVDAAITVEAFSEYCKVEV